MLLATDARLAQIEGSATWSSDIQELVEFSLIYEVLRGLTTGKIPILHQVLESNVTNGRLSALATSSRGLGEEEQQKPQHIEVEKKKCQEKGCTKQADAHTNFTYCSNIASPHGRCVWFRTKIKVGGRGACVTPALLITEKGSVQLHKKWIQMRAKEYRSVVHCVHNQPSESY